MEARLPAFLRHKQASDLIRLGRNADGGYVVCSNDVHASDWLIGLGISDDWSFEEQFLALRPVPLVAYDGSIGGKIFLKHFLKSLHKVHKPQVARSHLRTLLNYRAFFSGDRQHIQKFVGQASGKKQVAMRDILEGVTANGIFLKIDIEGAEYRILDELVAQQDRLTALAIELHDFDLHVERVRDFVSRFRLPIIHIHANDYAPVSENGLPQVLEVTFSRHARLSDEWRDYPQAIDRSNRPGGESIRLTFD